MRSSSKRSCVPAFLCAPGRLRVPVKRPVLRRSHAVACGVATPIVGCSVLHASSQGAVYVWTFRQNSSAPAGTFAWMLDNELARTVQLESDFYGESVSVSNGYLLVGSSTKLARAVRVLFLFVSLRGSLPPPPPSHPHTGACSAARVLSSRCTLPPSSGWGIVSLLPCAHVQGSAFVYKQDYETYTWQLHQVLQVPATSVHVPCFIGSSPSGMLTAVCSTPFMRRSLPGSHRFHWRQLWAAGGHQGHLAHCVCTQLPSWRTCGAMPATLPTLPPCMCLHACTLAAWEGGGHVVNQGRTAIDPCANRAGRGVWLALQRHHGLL